MRKILGLVFALVCGLTVAFGYGYDDVWAARKSRRKTSTKSTAYAAPTEAQCNVDIDYCFNRYCFDKKTLSQGVYSKCGAEPASRILINVEDCLQARSVIKSLNLTTGCKTFSYNRVLNLLSGKDVIETGLKRNSKECTKATKALQAAKACYAIMISSDGSNSLDRYNLLDANCGFAASGDSYMLNRFYEAGDYGESNLGAIDDLRATGQNTQKRENWRQVVDATLAGYTEIAELACGAEDYKLTKVNQYALDSRSNSAMVALNAEAEALGRNTANRIVNGWFRESDCVNSPLPEGGLYWKYKENGAPDCRIVCKEGWFVSKNSSLCAKAVEEKDKMPDLNIGTDWIAMAQPEPEDYSEDTTSIEFEYRYDDLFVDNNSSISGGARTCSTNLPNATWSPGKGMTGVCEVFFTKRSGGGCVTHSYQRITGDTSGKQPEYFCIGSSVGSYDRWYWMTMSEVNAALKKQGLKSDYANFGDDFAPGTAGGTVKSWCKQYYCAGKVADIPTNNNIANNNRTDGNGSIGGGSTGGDGGSVPSVDNGNTDSNGERTTTQDAEAKWCQEVPSVGTWLDKLNEWDTFLAGVNSTRCANNVNGVKSLISLYRNSQSTLVAGGRGGVSVYDVERGMREVKKCLCANSTGNKSNGRTGVSAACNAVNDLPNLLMSIGNSRTKWSNFIKSYKGNCSTSGMKTALREVGGQARAISSFKKCVCQNDTAGAGVSGGTGARDGGHSSSSGSFDGTNANDRNSSTSWKTVENAAACRKLGPVLPYQFNTGDDIEKWRKFLNAYGGGCDISGVWSVISEYDDDLQNSGYATPSLGIYQIQLFQTCVCGK